MFVWWGVYVGETTYMDTHRHVHTSLSASMKMRKGFRARFGSWDCLKKNETDILIKENNI